MTEGGYGKRESGMIRCPLFVAWSRKSLLCRPHIPGSQSTEIKFGSEAQRINQQQIFCMGCYDHCEHYLSWLHFQWIDED